MHIRRISLFLAVISISNFAFAGEIIEFPSHRVIRKPADPSMEHLLIDFSQSVRKLENCQVSLSGGYSWNPPGKNHYVRHPDEPQIQIPLQALQATLSAEQSVLLDRLMETFHLGPYAREVVEDIRDLHTALSESQRTLFVRLLKGMYPAL